ncbi:MAG: SurA N-terminal domain-containing protein [Hyphomicrobiales bacterium]|nr:SurA N-terminal domain-containing protein [Hyphomicrobiales bacterium]
MLTAMHEASKNWLGKIVLGVMFSLLIVSFAVWGIGDIFRGFGSGTLAKAGNVEISTEEYRAEYQTVLQNLQRQLRRVVTNEQARAEGIDRLVLNRMISEGLLEQQAKKLGLAMNNKAIAKGVLDDPRFQTPAGTFNRIAFQQALRDFGLNEARFLQKQRETYLRAQLINSFADDVPVSNAMLQIMHKMALETRSVEYFTLTANNIKDVQKPTDKDLAEYYNTHKASYRAPEYRKIVTLSVTPASIAKPDAISDETARKLYDEVKAKRFTTPEKREVQQIVFKPGEEAQAQAALDKLKAGAKFIDIAKERKLTETDINLGTLEKSKFTDPAIAEEAFKTEVGKFGAVVKGRFGPAILNVVKVEPASTRSFDEVKNELKKELATKAAKARIRKIYETIEDQRTSGKVLEEAAKSAGMKVRIIEAIDKNGRDKKGAEAPDLPEKRQLLPAVFASDIGVDNETLSTPAGGYIWFEVAAIDQARDRKLDEIKDRIAAAWRAQEVGKKLRAIADKAVKDMDGGKTIADVAKDLNAKVEIAPDVRRTTHPKLQPAVVSRVFSLPVGKAGTASGATMERTVFKILDSNTPPLTDKSKELEAVEKNLVQAHQQELLEEYVASLRKGLKVTINPTAMQNVVGGTN